MEWVCPDCGRTYHEAPESCAICGCEDVVPEGDPRLSPSFLGSIRERLLDPVRADTSLVSDDVYLVWAVRTLFLLAGLLVLAVLLT